MPALTLVFLALPASSFASGLSVTTVTWDIIGVKSNNTGLSTGPGPGFPVGVKVCNTTGSAITDVNTDFTFKSTNSYITLSGPATDSVGTLAASGSPGDCAYSYYSVDVDRVSGARGTNRSYEITAYDNSGGPPINDGTTGTRTLYVQNLIAQNRNTTHKISGAGGCNADYTVCDPAPTSLVVGQTYIYKLYAETSTGYEQLESFLSLPTGIFRTESVSAGYQTPSGATAQTPYANACGWTMNGALADFGSCTGPVVAPWAPGGKAGNKMVLTYQLKVVEVGSGSMNSLIYDFSGGSFHYNTDFGDPSKSINFTATVQYPLNVAVTGSGQVDSSPAAIQCGTVNVSCSNDFSGGSTVTLTATEDGTNDFNALASDCPGTGWTLSGGSGTSETFTCTVTMDEAKNATAIFAGPTYYPLNVETTGSGGVTADVGTINCSLTQTDCGYGYQSGSGVLLTATPDADNTFDPAASVCPGTGWTDVGPGSVRGAGASPTVYYCFVTMDAAKNATAVFNPVLPTVYPLTAEVTGGTGAITSSPTGIDCDQAAQPYCSESFDDGTSVTLTATPGPGQEFKTGVCPGTGWTPVGDGTYTCVVTMDAAKNATVAFQTPQQTLTASVTAGKGTISSSPAGIDCNRELVVTVAAAGEDCVKTYDENSVVTLTATPDSGYEFDSGTCPGTGWTAEAGGAYTCVVTMSEFREVKAAFKAKPTPPTPPTEQFKLSVTVNGSGSVTGSGIDCGSTCSKDYNSGDKVTLTAKPSEGYKFYPSGSSCPGDGWTAQADGSYTCTVTMDKAKGATAKFVKVEPKLELTITSNDKTVKKGDVITVSLDLKNTGTGDAKDTEACMTIPSGFALVKAAKGAKVKGSLVCWPTGDIEPGQSEKRWVKLRVITASSEKVTFRGAATAANAAGSKVDAKAKTKVRVKKSKKRPRPVTG